MITERIMTAEQAKELPLLMNARATSALTGKPERTLTRLAKEGKIPAVQVGHQWLFNRDKLLRACGIE